MKGISMHNVEMYVIVKRVDRAMADGEGQTEKQPSRGKKYVVVGRQSHTHGLCASVCNKCSFQITD